MRDDIALGASRLAAFESCRGPAVKICGMTRPEDVVAARDLGVWAIGFVFAPSRRRMGPSEARRLVESAGLGSRWGVQQSEGQSEARPEGRPLVVGVFTDAGVEEIQSVVEEVGLDAVQLHGLAGPETSEVAAAMGGSERTVLIIRALPVDADERDPGRLREAVVQARDEADILLLDTRVACAADNETGSAGRFGGSGTAFCWGLAGEAAEAAGRARLLVAGGIDPDNVAQALSESGAWGVDVSSGVEAAPGVKDMRLMERLVKRVREGIAK